MQKWHFRIYAKVLIPDSDKDLFIHPENIQTLIRISDYKNEHMARLQMRARLDKNLIDYIVSNAKTATIQLTIEKFDKQDQDQPIEDRNYEEYINDEFSIFVGNDINCNKEVDYKESIELDQPERKDVYQEINIGLMSKKCIEANKVASNVVFRETSMMSMAAYYLQGLHLLIEPFTYNPTIDQLVVPPQETLYKTIKFLDDIKVFYDTSFLFFIDEPNCTYLISRNGNGIEKKDDIYLDVCFQINPKDTENTGVPGMKKDSKESRFFADIDVADSKYTIDHDTAKIYTRIQEIINPEIKSTTSALGEIQKAVGGITSVVNQVKQTADNVIKDFNSMVSDTRGLANGLNKMKMLANSAVKDFLTPAINDELPAYLNKFNDLLSKLPESLSSTNSSGQPISMNIITKSNRDSIARSLESDKGKMDQNFAKVSQLSDDFGKLADNSTTCAYNMGNMTNNLGCFTPINAQKGVKATNKNIAQGNSDVDNVNKTSTDINNRSVCIDDTMRDYNSISTTVTDTIEKIEAALNNAQSKGIKIPDNAKQVMSELRNIKQSLSKVGEVGSKIANNLNKITNQIDSFKNMPQVLENAAKGFSGMVQKIGDVAVTNLTSKIKGIKTELNNIGNTAEKALAKIRNIGNDVPISFNIGDLANVSKSLSAISDLTGVGKLGRSSFDTKLEIGQSETVKEGLKILKTVNDNANKIKNVKSDIENQLNQVYVNKYDLDPSVFTPNKKYTIKNYNGHKDKDGLFLLNRKTEVYIREDDSFLCNTMLDFGKIADKK